MPETMLKKVAESQALRKAFNIHGVYCPEELGAGFEMANGDIVPTIEADCTRIEPDKSHLSIVKPQKAETEPLKKPKSPSVPAPPPPPQREPVTFEDDDWPDLPSVAEGITDDVALQVIDLLEAKHIAYDIHSNGIEGTISASSFNEKELLKASGFRWSSDQKRWLFKFRNDA